MAIKALTDIVPHPPRYMVRCSNCGVVSVELQLKEAVEVEENHRCGQGGKQVECFFCRRSIPLTAARHPEDSAAWVCEDTEGCDETINLAIRNDRARVAASTARAIQAASEGRASPDA